MTLTEKKQQFLDQIESLKAQRIADIDAKVNAFRAQLEAEPIEGIDQFDEVLKAIDVLIAFGDSDVDVEETQKTDPEHIEIEAEEDVAEKTATEHFSVQSGRSGMASVFQPRR